MTGSPIADRPNAPRHSAWREEMTETIREHQLSRRRFLGRAAAIGTCGLAGGLAAIEANCPAGCGRQCRQGLGRAAPAAEDHQAGDVYSPQQLGLREITTDAGIVGWGEMLKDKSKACAAGGRRWRRTW